MHTNIEMVLQLLMKWKHITVVISKGFFRCHVLYMYFLPVSNEVSFLIVIYWLYQYFCYTIRIILVTLYFNRYIFAEIKITKFLWNLWTYQAFWSKIKNVSLIHIEYFFMCIVIFIVLLKINNLDPHAMHHRFSSTRWKITRKNKHTELYLQCLHFTTGRLDSRQKHPTFYSIHVVQMAQLYRIKTYHILYN